MSPQTPLVRPASRASLVTTVVSTRNSEDEIGSLEVARADSVIKTMTSDIAHMQRAQAQHNQVIAAEVREEMFRERNVLEQHGAQDIVALKQMMTWFEKQKHIEVKREASQETQMRGSNFRGQVHDMIDEIRSEEAISMTSASEQYTKMMREAEAENH